MNPVRAQREEHGWTQVELAVLTGVASARISEIEIGNRPWRPELVALAEVFGKTPDELRETLNLWRKQKKDKLRRQARRIAKSDNRQNR